MDLLVDIGATLGETFLVTSSVDQAPGEVLLNNNSYADSEVIVASVDPNDMIVQPAGCGDNHAILGSELLNHTIYFENKPTATASAIYVLVVDTLDANLDLQTLQLGPSSKDNVLTFSLDPASREMTWFFDNYMLPPDVTPPEGEGFVSYSIMPKSGLADGTPIQSRAHIRFDYENWLAAPNAGPLQLMISTADANHNGLPDACDYVCGDADHSSGVDISDAVYLISYIFGGGPAPDPVLSGDADCSGDTPDISDVVYLIAYIFAGGPSPCASCK